MKTNPMTPLERRSSLALASVMTLRMLGLFMILPLFTLYARDLPGATTTLVGLALGIYGLTQALLQAPFGLLSDYFGRKPIITLGLLIFILGCAICASAHTIIMLIIGRSLQGCGAIGSVILALTADLTRFEQRTKAMAIMGISIGCSFLLAMLLGPVLHTWLSVPKIFMLCSLLGVMAILVLYSCVPTPAQLAKTAIQPNQLSKILTNSRLIYLNSGIFLLHVLLTVNFIVIPINLLSYLNIAANQQWHIYLPALVLSIICMLPGLRRTEYSPYLAKLLILAIAFLSLAELALWTTQHSVAGTAIGLFIFFTAFNLLEAYLPSLVTKVAPTAHRGAAIGLFSSCQFLGIFIGGSAGGWLYQHYQANGVFGVSLLCCLLWLAVTLNFTKHNNLLVSNS